MKKYIIHTENIENSKILEKLIDTILEILKAISSNTLIIEKLEHKKRITLNKKGHIDYWLNN